MKKNDIVIGICENYTFDGHGVVKIDGFPLFVKGLLEGEQAEIIVTMMKKTYGYGKLKTLLTVHPQRCEPRCPVAKQCGGCQLQHMSLPLQKAFKKQQVEEVMQRVGKLNVKVEDVYTMQDPWHYRNKAQIPIGLQNGHVVTGFYRIHSNTIIDMEHCYIQSESINAVFQEVKQLLEGEPDLSSVRHLVIKHAFATKELMVALVVRHANLTSIKEKLLQLPKTFPNIKSILLNINTTQGNTVLGKAVQVLYGDDYITDEIHGLKFRISLHSFYQVNPIQTEVLYGLALEFAELSGQEEVIDLYCGVGTISMFLAKQAKHVTGIEVVPQAIEDAKRNAAYNGCKNIDFICSDAAAYAKQAVDENKKIDVVVVDPPRKGCDKEALESIVKMRPKRIVYVSCKASTLARDLRILEDLGYQTTKIQPVDMFPQTYGIETVAQLIRK